MYNALAEAISMSTGLTNVGTMITTVVGVITGNEVLMTLFCGSLLENRCTKYY